MKMLKPGLNPFGSKLIHPQSKGIEIENSTKKIRWEIGWEERTRLLKRPSSHCFALLKFQFKVNLKKVHCSLVALFALSQILRENLEHCRYFEKEEALKLVNL